MNSPSYSLVIYICIFLNTKYCAADINFNLKRNTLSRNFCSESSDMSSADWRMNSEPVHGMKKQKLHYTNISRNIGKVSLDPSGRVECNISTPYPQTIREGLEIKLCENNFESINRHDKPVPLFYWGYNDSKFPAPSVFLGADYNFSKIWFGVTRLMMRFSWDHKLNVGSKSKNFNKMNTFGSSTLKKLINYYNININVDKGLLKYKDYGVKFSIIFPKNGYSNEINNCSLLNNSRLVNSSIEDPSIPSLSIRLDSIPSGSRKCATISFQTPICKRIRLVSKSTFLLKNIYSLSNVLSENYASRIPSIVNWNEGTWIPQMSLTGDGTLFCRSTLGFQSPPNLRSISSLLGIKDGVASNKYNNYGVRITAKKKFRWNTFSMISDGDSFDNNTHLRLELCGLGLNGNSYNSIRIDSLLERIIDSSRVTIVHEQILSNNNN